MKNHYEVSGQLRWHSLRFSFLHLIHHLHLPDGDESSESHGLCIPPGPVRTPWFTHLHLPMSWTCNLNLDIPWGRLVLLLNDIALCIHIITSTFTSHRGPCSQSTNQPTNLPAVISNSFFSQLLLNERILLPALLTWDANVALHKWMSIC